jgi:serine/threonine protein phosphatase PrpC
MEPDDIIILASDGIHTLHTPDILRTVSANAGKEPEAMADALLGAVEAAADDHQDNTTIVVAQARAD